MFFANRIAWSKDANDNLASVTDAENNTTSYLYDERDLLYKVTDARTYFTRYTYDGNGNLSLLRDARGKETSYAYDGFDRLWTTTYPGTTTEVLAYDKAGNITSRKNRRNQTIAYTYDALNRLDTKTPPDTGLVDYDYDPGSRLTDVTDSNGTTHYAYVSGVNRLQSVTYGYGGPAPRVVSYLYDPNGNRTRLTYPDGGANYITYEWDQMNRLDEMKDSSENIIADYAYDTLSRRTQADLLNGTRAEYGYDNIDRLVSLLNKKVSPESIFSEYLFGLYDDVGNLKQMSRDGEGYTFGYDAIYQLKTADYPEGHHSSDKTYYYDALGNRTSIIGGGLESYTTNALNQYTKVGGVDFSYDGDGNLTSDGVNSYTYDSENRLATTGSYTYTYDPFGRRTRKQGPGVDVTFIYDGDQVIEERDSGCSVIATYVYGPGIDECISMERGGETYYYHYDRLGSVVNLSDSSGDLVETYQYDAWGNADTYGAVGNPYFFTGRRYDPETGNYYYRARYYDPAIGRFLQTDPLGYFDGPNLYTYVTNNPVNLIDPFGLCKGKNLSVWDEWWRQMYLDLTGQKDPTFAVREGGLFIDPSYWRNVGYEFTTMESAQRALGAFIVTASFLAFALPIAGQIQAGALGTASIAAHGLESETLGMAGTIGGGIGKALLVIPGAALYAETFKPPEERSFDMGVALYGR